MNIQLIGMRGVGKSNVARRLSVLTKMPVMATDTLVTYESGLTVPQFVEVHGWAAFRDLEHVILGKLASLDGIIVDCGGGIIVEIVEGQETYSERNVDVLRRMGPIVWLRGDIARLAAKTAGDPTRPSLDATRSAEAVMRAREPWYAQAAEWSVDVEPGRRQQAAMAVAAHYELTLA